jgi:hypothetical protein
MSESKTSPQFWATVMIVVAIIGCVGTVISALISKFPLSTPTPPVATQIIIATQVVPVTQFPTILPSPFPLNTPLATSTFNPSTLSPCTGSISSGLVQEWSTIGETNDKEKVKDYLQQFYKVFFESSSKPAEFHGGDTVPKGSIIATDFGGLGETEVWKNYPLQSVVHYRSWGLFETSDNFYVPNGGGGQCAVIVP